MILALLYLTGPALYLMRAAWHRYGARAECLALTEEATVVGSDAYRSQL